MEGNMKTEGKLEDMCFYHKQSRVQRNMELNNGQGIKGTAGYKKCYDCGGYNFKCKMYLSNYDAMGGERKLNQ
jgi:hypothetical protein